MSWLYHGQKKLIFYDFFQFFFFRIGDVFEMYFIHWFLELLEHLKKTLHNCIYLAYIFKIKDPYLNTIFLRLKILIL